MWFRMTNFITVFGTCQFLINKYQDVQNACLFVVVIWASWAICQTLKEPIGIQLDDANISFLSTKFHQKLYQVSESFTSFQVFQRNLIFHSLGLLPALIEWALNNINRVVSDVTVFSSIKYTSSLFYALFGKMSVLNNGVNIERSLYYMPVHCSTVNDYKLYIHRPIISSYSWNLNLNVITVMRGR